MNNAGIASTAPALDISVAEFDRVIATNLRGVWLASTVAARRWRDDGRGGVIVNIASILGSRVAGATAPYAVSKAGVVQMTQAHAIEWARHRNPRERARAGLYRHRHQRRVLSTEAGQAMIKRIPMRRLGRPEDLDGAFLLLATDLSSWMTGSILTVDGGHLVSSL